jgi:hypothetical protein
MISISPLFGHSPDPRVQKAGQTPEIVLVSSWFSNPVLLLLGGSYNLLTTGRARHMRDIRDKQAMGV